ncbi:MAG: glutathione metabolism protein [Alphaproteobacteria bacterium]|nr:glutathione metabolism protein [Alphaproteobacteria bacterium]
METALPALSGTALYASLLAVVWVFTSARVSMIRNKEKVPFGDGGKETVLHRVRAFASNAEYVPYALLLLGLAEYTGTASWYVHVAGIVLVVARVVHSYAINEGHARSPFRILGSVATNTVILATAGVLFVHVVASGA